MVGRLAVDQFASSQEVQPDAQTGVLGPDTADTINLVRPSRATRVQREPGHDFHTCSRSVSLADVVDLVES